MADDRQDSDNRFNAKITSAVIITSIVAASGGLIFGFDIGISGCLFFRFPLYQLLTLLDTSRGLLTSNLCVLFLACLITHDLSSFVLLALFSRRQVPHFKEVYM